jgi:hypothetical protein
VRPLFLALLCLAAVSANAQDPTDPTILDNDPGNESATSVEKLPKGQIAILGNVQLTSNRVQLYLLDKSNRLVFSQPLSLYTLMGPLFAMPPADEFAGTLAVVDDRRFVATFVNISGGQCRTVAAMVRTDGGWDWQTQLPTVGNSFAFDRPPRAAVAPGGIVVIAYGALGQTRLARIGADGVVLGESSWPGDDGSGSTPFGLDVNSGAIWLGVQNGLGLASRYGVVKFDLNGQFLWAKSQTQDVINILGPAWIRGLDNGTAVVVAGEEGPFGSHRTTLTRYAADGAVLNRRMEPPPEVNSGAILLSASILPNGRLAYSMILASAPVLTVGNADGSIVWQQNVTGQLGASGSAFPATVDLDPTTLALAVAHDSIGFSTFTKTGAMSSNETFPVSGEYVRALWSAGGRVTTVINAGPHITVFSRETSPGATQMTVRRPR